MAERCVGQSFADDGSRLAAPARGIFRIRLVNIPAKGKSPGVEMARSASPSFFNSEGDPLLPALCR